MGGVDLGSEATRRGLLFSFCEGLTTTGMLAMTETFNVAAAVSLGASPMAISLLSALPLGIGYVCLYLAPALASPARGRKHYVLLGIRMQAILLIACAFTGWLSAPWAPVAFITVFVIAAVSSHATGAFWVAWMGDLIPPSVRGRHWAWRSTWFACMSLACSLTAGFVARHYDAKSAPWIFFCGIFLAASAFRFGGLEFLRRQYEPPPSKPLEVFSPLRFRPKPRFLAFSLASGGFLGSASMTVPFFSVWYLRDLHFNYLWLSLLSCAGALGSIACTRAWGRLSDRLGSGRVLAIGGFLSALTPLPSLFISRPLFLCLANFCAGGVWAGYSLANFNHLLSATENDQRHHYIAFNSLVTGVMASGFALLGGFLATRLPVLNGWRLRSLFLGAALLRFAIWVAFFRRPRIGATGPQAA